MNLTFTPESIAGVVQNIEAANEGFRALYPGDVTTRQPVHTVYGGAHLFKSDTASKLGGIALRNMDAYAPNFVAFAKALGLPGAAALPDTTADVEHLAQIIAKDPEAASFSHEPAWMAYTVYQRVREKLQREPVEDYRVDFEDGYGNRPDEEEDIHAVNVGKELAAGIENGKLPPFIGIRIKPFTLESYRRAVRTLDLCITTLAQASGGKVPANFVITLPKVTMPEQVTALADLVDQLEAKNGIQPGAIGLDLMIETPQAIIDDTGANTVSLLVRAGRGRVRYCAYGTYDYTALVNITAHYQTHTHPAADFARHVMQVSLAGTGVSISDGATTIMPIGPHRATKETPLTAQQEAENMAVVQAAWKLHYNNVRHSLRHAFYQGWDLNPAQLPVRYAAVYTFFLESLDDASKRLNRFVDAAAQATLSGNMFDDAATGQGLLNFYLRGIACGAITEEEATSTGVTLEELRGRSFVKIVQNRAYKKTL
ncbi:MAG: phosphoenolpyruvate kinase [Caldilineales bacterium]